MEGSAREGGKQDDVMKRRTNTRAGLGWGVGVSGVGRWGEISRTGRRTE